MSKDTCPRFSRAHEKHALRKEMSCDTIPTRSRSGRDQSNQREIILNLQTDLAMIVNENIKLANKNALLALNVQECEDKIKQLQCELNESKSTYKNEMISFQKRLTELQDLFQEKTEALNKKEIVHAEEIEELKRIHSKNENLAIDQEMVLIDEIGKLKDKFEGAKKYGKEVSTQLKKSKEKLSRYKDKFKMCVDTITKMNTFLNHLKIKPPQTDQICQTEELCKFHTARCCTYNECENIILSELFFKEHAVQSAIEEIFFDHDQTFN
ncbi:dynein regulatory complex protein 9-like [Onthophagus taurus]|uniref:dynein regulatory complex protein 9-like n=1 Tax=Onthophagus taurus TaxID=166361 RepID=UPI0039BE2A63